MDRAARFLTLSLPGQIVLPAEQIATSVRKMFKDCKLLEDVLGWFRLKNIDDPVKLAQITSPDLPCYSKNKGRYEFAFGAIFLL